MPCYKMDHRAIHGALQSSPIVPVEKEDGTLRLCMDFRRLKELGHHINSKCTIYITIQVTVPQIL